MFTQTITKVDNIVKEASLSQRNLVTKLLIKTAQKYKLQISNYELKSHGSNDYFWGLISNNLKLIPISIHNQLIIKNQKEWNINTHEASNLIEDLLQINLKIKN